VAWFLYFIGAAWIAIGSCFILYTSQTRSAAKTLLSKPHPKVLAAIPFAAGLLFIMTAATASHPWIIRLFGVLGLIKGAFIFINPNNLHNKILDWYLTALSDQAHRFLGIITMILGAALLSWIL